MRDVDGSLDNASARGGIEHPRRRSRWLRRSRAARDSVRERRRGVVVVPARVDQIIHARLRESLRCIS